MTIKIEVVRSEDPGVLVLKVEGDVDMDSSPALREQIAKELKGTSCLKVDLSSVAYLDSSGIAVLIQGHKSAQKTDVAYSLLNPSSQVKAVIELAQLNQLFTIEES